METKSLCLNDVFLDACRNNEEAENSPSPAVAVECLRSALEGMSKLHETLALYGVAAGVLLSNMVKNAAKLKTEHPDVYQSTILPVFGDTFELARHLLTHYSEELGHCHTVEAIVRDQLLREAKIDPNDPEAVRRHYESVLVGRVLPATSAN